ncbi:diguanylate cyclase/phosphodiesterase (GGDEF & EAL domains) [Sulfurimonas gotlandica GD1]|uniref:Diguanylate cyclase/phosphodiesterase (GGDEF & EAL domains) n=2 Tax=Sulfurimonas TaxID=202746 RepID=B6BGZ0_SULGG|nr:diguanylate cyclase/phosphodiesterase, putative [Sulfurimonas gotlandica GD1]EHP29774.1 diguanylate cyclase/phosphodiesterase (GGDEF & EAL domains) [Sulfurimonas gotlandica GD1]
MGLPIFAMVLILVSHRLITSYKNLDSSFYIEVILLLAFSIYFIFYIIYKSFDIRITESVTKTFTREYLYKYLKKELKANNEYTLLLISIDNLSDINSRYGIKNGDKVLKQVVLWTSEYLKSKEITNFPMGHIKGGDFVIGLRGSKNEYSTILELMCLKSDEFTVDDIEVKISGAITDKTFSDELDYLVENLFEIQERNRNQKLLFQNTQEISPQKQESFVISAIKNRSFIVMTQDVFEDEVCVIKECFVKLKTPNSEIIHQKTYMKVLDKLGLMVDFDLMILEQNIAKCCSDSKEIFAMNISPSSLRNPSFMFRAKELLNANSEIKNRLIFLLSESHYYSQVSKYNSTLKVLRDMGVIIAIDRLGAIHTSFLYLRDLDIDMVRYDSSYTKEIKDEKYNSAIDGFNVMAHNRGVKTWIRMVDSQEIKDEAKELKIDYIQGNFMAPVEKKYEN